MAYQLLGQIQIAWIGDGAGAMSVPGAQVLEVQVGGGANSAGGNNATVPVPGGDAPSTANITTACNTLATQIAALFNAQIGRIQGFATGGG